MYYQEMVINGVLHHRGTPDGEWMPFTLAQLTKYYLETKEESMRFYTKLQNSYKHIDACLDILNKAPSQ